MSDILNKVTRLFEFHKVRPLCSFDAYDAIVEEAIEGFDPREIRRYASLNSEVASGKNPAALLCALAGKELDENEANIEELDLAYHAMRIKWDFCSNFIVERVLSKCISHMDQIVSSFYT